MVGASAGSHPRPLLNRPRPIPRRPRLPSPSRTGYAVEVAGRGVGEYNAADRPATVFGPTLKWRGIKMPVTGFCMKCKTAREIADPQPTQLKNGKPATTGTCPGCGTKIFKIGKAV